MKLRVPNDTALSHFAAADLKLRLNQHDHLAICCQQRRESWKDQGHRYETNIAYRERARLPDIRLLKISGVGMIANYNSRIRAQLPIELRRADIHRIDASRAALQQTIREAARRRADIETC